MAINMKKNVQMPIKIIVIGVSDGMIVFLLELQ